MRENLLFLTISVSVIVSLIVGMEVGKWTKSCRIEATKVQELAKDIGKERDYYKSMVDSLFPSCMKRDAFLATGYDLSYKSCGKWAKFKRTKYGTPPSYLRTVAVDPRVIPLGSLVFIKGLGWFVAEDTGRKIKGKRLDVFFDTTRKALNFGVKRVIVFHYNQRCFDKVVEKHKYMGSITF